MSIVILFIFLLTAVYSDWRFGKIYNWQIILGSLAGICYRYYAGGPPGVLEGICAAFIPILFIFRYLMSYVHDIFTTNQWRLYEEAGKQSAAETKRYKIHFAFPVFVSALFHIGGLY